MKKYLLLLLATFLLTATNSCAQVKIILDTDFGGDVDDLGALVMLNNFVDKGECNLLAVMCWSTEQYSVSAVDAVNRYYKHPDIPIGTRKDSTHYDSWNYSKTIADKFPHKLSYKEAEDATFLYRKLLAASDDKSIVIVTVGPLMNIQNLIKSGADAISNLNGKELIAKKVKEFVIMGGQFPEGKQEWNFNGNMPGVTQFVLQNITVPITFSGFEVGVVIKTGEVFNQINANTPLYAGFMHFSQNAPWVKENFKGKILDNATYDQTAVLYAVREGLGTYWDKIEDGYCLPDETGGNKWVTGSPTNQSYLKLKMDPEEIALLIESIMLNKF
jgi:inosine-uridine nucleoside N-ribohydrolase